MTPLETLRRYRELSPWNVRGLAKLAGSILRASGIRPTSQTASNTPSVRAIRYYVARGLMDHPEGNGPAAVYTYRHLLQLLTIKLRQMEGATLERIGRDLTTLLGDALERRLATALAGSLPYPGELDLDGRSIAGRTGQALSQWQEDNSDPGAPTPSVNVQWHHVQVAPGLELHIHEGHPLADALAEGPLIRDAVRRAIMPFTSRET